MSSSCMVSCYKARIFVLYAFMCVCRVVVFYRCGGGGGTMNDVSLGSHRVVCLLTDNVADWNRISCHPFSSVSSVIVANGMLEYSCSFYEAESVTSSTAYVVIEDFLRYNP
jgi:hypothetical protein